MIERLIQLFSETNPNPCSYSPMSQHKIRVSVKMVQTEKYYPSFRFSSINYSSVPLNLKGYERGIQKKKGDLLVKVYKIRETIRNNFQYTTYNAERTLLQ